MQCQDALPRNRINPLYVWLIFACTGTRSRVIPVWLPGSIFIMNSEFAGGELILIDLR